MTSLRLLQCFVAGSVLLTLLWMPAIAAAPKEETCVNAGSAPICIAKAWLGCEYLNPDFCDLIGVSRALYSKNDLPDLGPVTTIAKTAPWKLTFEQLFGAIADGDTEWRFEGARRVSAERFKSALPHDPNLEGTIEVMLESNFGDIYLTYSVFAKRVGEEWRFASWSRLNVMYDSFANRDVPAKDQMCDTGQRDKCEKYLRRVKPWTEVGPEGEPRKK